MNSQANQRRKYRIGSRSSGREVCGNSLGKLLVAALLLVAGAAQALTIQLIDVGTTPMTPAQLTAFQQAAQVWENRLADPITIKLNVAWEEPGYFSNPTGTLASTQSARTTPVWGAALLSMALDSDSTTETNAIVQLPGIIPIVDLNGPRNANKVTISTANAKALSLATTLDPLYGAALDNNADGDIRYNKNFLTEFDIDRSDGINASQYDFVGVAAHEIGHALGFFGMTEIQDDPRNVDFTFFPSILDVWRFVEAGGTHALNTESRQVTAGPAEYDDSVIDAFFSRGLQVSDPNCNTASGRCQAAHWRDDEGNLMDPSVATGVLVNPLSDDLHALDYIGYEQRLIRIDIIRWLRDLRWLFFDPNLVGQPPIPIPGGGFPPPPPPDELQPAGKENLALIANIDFGANPSTKEPIFGGLRTLLGIAEFREAAPPAVQEPLNVSPPEDDQFEDLEPPRLPMKLMPPALCFSNFISDDQGGIPFSARPFGGQDCISFDDTAGDFGGWRLPLCVDGLGDQMPGDCDAFITLVLQLEQAVDGVTLDSLLNVGMKIDPAVEDNGVVIYDPAAMGMADSDGDTIADVGDNCTQQTNPDQLDTDNDGIGNVCDCDFNQDNFCGGPDFTLFIGCFNAPTNGKPVCEAADMNGDGFVGGPDFSLFIGGFNAPPGPSAGL